tara:strand:+ start:281 stop:409 length:129 start_codon:yes stop_codon:yes gene_type:complete
MLKNILFFGLNVKNKWNKKAKRIVLINRKPKRRYFNGKDHFI